MLSTWPKVSSLSWTYCRIPRADLLLIAGATGLAGLLAGLGEDGEQDGGEDRDDGDHDEKLDQREA